MEQPLSLSLYRSNEPVTEPTAEQWKQLYQYFVNAEETNSIVTSVSIRHHWPTAPEKIPELESVRWYMYRYWRWFLFCVDDQVKPYRYTVGQIKGYPVDYFVQAHMDHTRMRYLFHFMQSIEEDKEDRRRASGTGQPRKPHATAGPTTPQETLIELAQDEPELDNNVIRIDTHAREEGPIDEDAAALALEAEQGVTEPAIDPTASIDEEGTEDSKQREESAEPTTPEQPPAVISTSVESTPAKEEPHRSRRLLLTSIAVGLCIVATVAYFLLTRASR